MSVSTVATYLYQEGFEETRKGIFISKEINTTITSTMNPNLFNVTVNEFTYKDIFDIDLDKVVDAIHTYEGTTLVVVLYNLQRAVKAKFVLPIMEVI